MEDYQVNKLFISLVFWWLHWHWQQSLKSFPLISTAISIALITKYLLGLVCYHIQWNHPLFSLISTLLIILKILSLQCLGCKFDLNLLQISLIFIAFFFFNCPKCFDSNSAHLNLIIYLILFTLPLQNFKLFRISNFINLNHYFNNEIYLYPIFETDFLNSHYLKLFLFIKIDFFMVYKLILYLQKIIYLSFPSYQQFRLPYCLNPNALLF